ncbi:hypothetical protein [Deinococcus sp. JMULE3]|uniref:hypothetical protein n=1 Tax=Deinococcus sp. JMULE3 TaxID=2518341 RepID=UPI00157765C0|nr:hypothetical protein [Deinococcus sp. JMULE3]NTY02385.1 hypothetical protein [Deinococcus sp. JMULE3]
MIYQSVPNPADPTYTAFNRDAYRSGEVLPNSGFLRVEVGPVGATVSYVRSFLPKDVSSTQVNDVAFQYTVKARE